MKKHFTLIELLVVSANDAITSDNKVKYDMDK